MQITLYNNKSSNETVNKTLQTIKSGINCSLKDDTNMLTPVILLSKNAVGEVTAFNYCYIDIFKRYYYVTELKECLGNILQISAKCDVLMSHSGEIKNLNAIVERQQNFYNLYLSNLQIPNLSYKRVQTKLFPIQPLQVEGTMILGVTGRG